MEHDADNVVLEFELPIDIRTIRQEVRDLSYRIKGSLHDKDILREYHEKQQAYKDIFESYMQILAGFKYNFRRIDINNHAAESMYLKLYRIIYNKMRKETNEYRDFLLAIENPTSYIEKQKQQQQQTEPTGFIATKLSSTAKKYTLGDGKYLPLLETQNYDTNPRHRTRKSTKEKLQF